MAKAFDSEQQRVAGQLLAEAQRFGAGPRATKALLLAGYVESGLRNLSYGDRDSLGVLQQRPSQGWRNPRNVPKAADAFLQHALRLNATGRYRTAGQLAQAVQRSAFPDRYDAAAPAIRNLLSGVKGSGGGTAGVGGSVGSVTVPGAAGAASTPAGSDGALALVQALSQQQRPQVQSAPLAAPSFSAAPVLPAGYQAPQSGAVSTPPVDTAALLSAIRTQGGDTPGQAAGRITVSGTAGSNSGGVGGAGGRIKFAPGADRPGVKTQAPVLEFAKEVSAIYGHPLTIGTGTHHDRMTVNGNVSDHYAGNAVDIPASGAQLLRLGRAALVAAGLPARKARKATGGLYNVGGHQVIFLTNEGGNHFNHLHISAK